MANLRTSIGKITGGGIKQHLRADLDIVPEEIDVGAYVLILGERWDYYALVADLAHNSGGDRRFAERPIQDRLPDGLARRVNRRTLKPTAQLMTNLCMPAGDGSTTNKPVPATSLPPLHAPVCLAEADDIARLFGQPEQLGHWVVGYTREQGHPVAIDLRNLIRRSVGFFGATGTGKSMIARVILSGLIRMDLAATLTIDLHNELAYDDTATDSGGTDMHVWPRKGNAHPGSPPGSCSGTWNDGYPGLGHPAARGRTQPDRCHPYSYQRAGSRLWQELAERISSA